MKMRITLKERIKTQRKIVSFRLDKSNAVGVGTTAVKPYIHMPSGLSLVRKPGGGGGGVLPIMAYTGRLHPKGVPSGILNGRDFTGCSI